MAKKKHKQKQKQKQKTVKIYHHLPYADNTFDPKKDMDRMMEKLKPPTETTFKGIQPKSTKSGRRTAKFIDSYSSKDELIPGRNITYRDGQWNGGNNK